MGSSYELTKWQAHYEVAEPLQKKGAPLIILQPGGVTGAGDEFPHIQALQLFLQRMPVMVGARSGLTLAHVEDIAEGHILALEKGKAGESYILAGEALTYKQVFAMCEKITGIRSTGLWAPGWVAGISSALLGLLERLGMRGPFSSEALATMNDYTFWAKADKARRELGWKPTSDRRDTERCAGVLAGQVSARDRKDTGRISRQSEGGMINFCASNWRGAPSGATPFPADGRCGIDGKDAHQSLKKYESEE